MTRPATVADVVGLWRRADIVLPDGSRDDTSFVVWLQARRHFADLRQPADRPEFGGVTGPDDLTPGQRAWLDRQEGFAGELVPDPLVPSASRQGRSGVEWRRWIDVRPPTGQADAGLLCFDGDTLIERGRDVGYTERWEALHQPGASTASLWLRQPRADRDKTGRGADRRAMVVRCGAHFIWATEDAPRAVVAFGTIDGSGWRTDRVTTPWTEGATFLPSLADGRWRFGDGPDDTPWIIDASEGDMLRATRC